MAPVPKRYHILLTGGGSGGHIYPLFAVAEELQRAAAAQGIAVEIDYLGPRDVYAEALGNAGIKIHGLVSGKVRNYSVLENLLDIPKFALGLLQAFWKMYWLMPDAIFSKGGTGAFLAVLAGRFYRIPVLIHESDAIPGTTNLLSARFAARIALTFEEARVYFDPKKTAVVGNPVRPWLLVDIPDEAAAKKELGFNPAKPLLLVIGGSQGARRLNEFVLENLGALLKETQVLHQTGRGNFEDVAKLSQAALGPQAGEAGYRPVPYLDEQMKSALAAADLIAGRAGSGTIAEAAAAGKPAILVPIAESAHDHQRANAAAYAKTGAAVVIAEANLLPGIFLAELRSLLRNPESLKKMGEAARSFCKPDAAKTLAQEVLFLARRGE